MDFEFQVNAHDLKIRPVNLPVNSKKNRINHTKKLLSCAFDYFENEINSTIQSIQR